MFITEVSDTKNLVIYRKLVPIDSIKSGYDSKEFCEYKILKVINIKRGQALQSIYLQSPHRTMDNE
jgi:hypothetical protein